MAGTDVDGAQAVTYHHFTVDVEEHFQVSALEPYVARAAWDGMASRVVASTQRLLDLLERHDARGTFFVLGWIGQRHPTLVREIAARGHEVASHGSDHVRVTQLNAHQFRRCARESKQTLEQITGAPVLGYRAPSFSIVPGHEWALDILIEEGYTYDSSLYPVRRRGYGYPGGAEEPHVLHRGGGSLLEFPPATVRAFGQTLPAGGGAYLRLLPYGLTHAGVARCERLRRPATLYIHPWEADPQQPRLRVPLPTRIRHYGGLHRTMPRLARLLSAFRFGPIADSLPPGTAAAPPAADLRCRTMAGA